MIMQEEDDYEPNCHNMKKAKISSNKKTEFTFDKDEKYNDYNQPNIKAKNKSNEEKRKNKQHDIHNNDYQLSSSPQSFKGNKSIKYNPPLTLSSQPKMNKSCNDNDRKTNKSPINKKNPNEEESKEEILEHLLRIFKVQSSVVPFINTFRFHTKVNQTLKSNIPIIINYSILIQPSNELALLGNHWNDIRISQTSTEIPHSQNASLKENHSHIIESNLQGIFLFMQILLYNNPSIKVIPYTFYRSVKKLKKSIKDISSEEFCSIILKRIQPDSTDLISSLSSLYTELIQSNQNLLHFNRIIIFLNKINRHVNSTCLRDVLSLFNPLTTISHNDHFFKSSSVHFINLREDTDFTEFTLKSLAKKENKIAMNDFNKEQFNSINKSINMTMSTRVKHTDVIESELKHLIETAEYEDALVLVSYKTTKLIKKLLMNTIVGQLAKNYDCLLDEMIRIHKATKPMKNMNCFKKSKMNNNKEEEAEMYKIKDCEKYFNDLLNEYLDYELISNYKTLYDDVNIKINENYHNIIQLLNERIRLSNCLDPPCDYWIKFKLILKNQYKESIITLDSLYYAPNLFNYLMTIIKSNYISLTHY